MRKVKHSFNYQLYYRLQFCMECIFYNYKSNISFSSALPIFRSSLNNILNYDMIIFHIEIRARLIQGGWWIIMEFYDLLEANNLKQYKKFPSNQFKKKWCITIQMKELFESFNQKETATKIASTLCFKVWHILYEIYSAVSHHAH